MTKCVKGVINVPGYKGQESHFITLDQKVTFSQKEQKVTESYSSFRTGNVLVTPTLCGGIVSPMRFIILRVLERKSEDNCQEGVPLTVQER